MFFGKLAGGVFGYYLAGLWGALFGVVVGHMFDVGFRRAMNHDHEAEARVAQEVFFETIFRIMGKLAKADGRISEEEVATAETLMGQLGLSPASRKLAIKLFKEGAAPGFSAEQQIRSFIANGARSETAHMLLEFLIAIALSDGEIHPAERDLLQSVALNLGMRQDQFDELIAMLTAQAGFHGGVSSEAQLEQAYAALGAKEEMTDAEIKKRYRKLMSEHHPDKLIAQGLPEEMVKLATEKSQEIQTAYDLVKKSRKS